MFLIISSNYDHDIVPKYKYFPTQKKTKDKEKQEGKILMLACLDLYASYSFLSNLFIRTKKES